MKLFEQAITKKIELSEEKLMAKSYKKYIWEFYQAYNIARALIGQFDPLEKKKIRLYRKFLLTGENINSNSFKKIEVYIRKDVGVIIKANKIIERAKEEAGFEFGEYYKPFTLGILSADYPDD